MREERYVIGIDQSTQGTKALLFNGEGSLVLRQDAPHRQLVNEKGWISHDPEEIYRNTIKTVTGLIRASGIKESQLAAMGISNQRETSLIWDKISGKPLNDAVVWQCARAEKICRKVEQEGKASLIRQRTGLTLSPYFPASKFAWLLQETKGARELAARHELCFGTMDTWLVYRLTRGRSYQTDYSNASRTQLYHIFDLKWNEEICGIFGIDPEDLPTVRDSDSLFGETDLEGFLEKPVPIHCVLGDSHGALFGQGCIRPGMIKATYGTGSSVMMNIGQEPALGSHGVVTSLAWGMGGKVNYVLEGNINYTGAVISWLKDDLGMIRSPEETEILCRKAREEGIPYFVPAFTGLGAPYWDSQARGAMVNLNRASGRAEIVRACVDSIAYQIADVVRAMEQDSGIGVKELRVDGGPSQNTYLMEFQSDVLNAEIMVPGCQELSGLGAAYGAGIGIGLYDDKIFERMERRSYRPQMDSALRERKWRGWREAVGKVLTKK